MNSKLLLGIAYIKFKKVDEAVKIYHSLAEDQKFINIFIFFRLPKK